MKKYLIKDPIYEAHLSFFIGDREKFNNYLKKCDIPEECFATGVGKFIFDEENNYFIIWIPTLDSYTIGTLVHELHHYACQVFDNRRIPISIHNDESMAYYKSMTIRNIFEKTGFEVVDNFGKKKKKNKKDKK
jgi:hypothetical protein